MEPLAPDHSPVFKDPTSFIANTGVPWSGYYDHREWQVADLYITEGAIQVLLVEPNAFLRERLYTDEHLSAAMDYLRSLLWRAYRLNAIAGHMVLCRNSELKEVEERLSSKDWSRTTPIALEHLMLEATAINFEEKVAQTLVNMGREWSREHKPIQLPYSWYNPGQGFGMEFQDLPQARGNGLAFACSSEEAFFAFMALKDRGWLAFQHNSNSATLSAEGYAEVDRIKRGKGSGAQRAFLVRRWDPSRDSFFQEVHDKVQEQIGVTLEPVWAQEHTERIDERIFNSLDAAAVVVVDIDKTKFNVGLEAGYALALRKPIVAIREEPKKAVDKPLPFDIITLNCHDYKTDATGKAELVKKLCARITFGLSRSKLR